ncbi:hypothetical protein CHU98_g11231 [Xylaria longipes]|nr:hypothetical protein CHU98_g11231 [Xylaria longipes]
MSAGPGLLRNGISEGSDKETNNVAHIHNDRTSVQANLQVVPRPPDIARAELPQRHPSPIMDDPPFAVARQAHIGRQRPQRLLVGVQCANVSLVFKF